MGTFERLSVVVIGVILVMILVVAVVTWTEEPQPGCAPGTVAELPNAPGADVGQDPLPPRDEPQAPDPLPKVDPLPPVDPPKPAPIEKTETPAPAPAAAKVHVVAAGETLSEISQKYYPSSKFWRQLMTFNGLESESIHTGQKIKIPSLHDLGIENDQTKVAPTEVAKTPSADAPKPGATYTVRHGDDLMKIAKQVYKDVTRWPDIWIANREKLPTPDVSEGMVLALPN